MQTAEDILNNALETGLARAEVVMTQTLASLPADKIVRTPALRFHEKLGLIHMSVGSENWRVHSHALGQICQEFKIPRSYVNDLATRDPDLLVHNLDRLAVLTDERRLVRTHSGEVRGFLSDRYKRLDSGAIIEAFISANEKVGARPIADERSGLGSTLTDIRWCLSTVIPQIFHLPSGDPVVVGAQLRHSDYGAGALDLGLYLVRVLCLNGAYSASALRQIHLGSRLQDSIEYSDRTVRLDSAASASALSDAMGSMLAPARIDNLIDAIARAETKSANWNTVKARLAKKLVKSELEAAETAFEGPDVVNLPPVRSMWRASNAISWIAKTGSNTERKLELERIAGELLD